MKPIGRSASRRHAMSCLLVALGVGAALAAAPRALADDAAPPAPPAAAGPPPLAPPATVSDKVVQENLFWESVQKSNTLADYKAYLEAFPTGVYAPLAKNCIAALSAPPAAAPALAQPAPVQPPPAAAEANPPAQPGPGPGQPPPGASDEANAPQQPGQGPGQPPPGASDEANAPQQPGQGPGQGPPGGMEAGAPPPDAVRAEIATPESEQSLNLNRRDLMEVQRRLATLGLYGGPIDGDIGPGSRGAIAEWQRRQGASPTGMLGPVQLQALRAEAGPVNGQRVEGGGCPPGFHPGPYGRRCWANR